MPGTITKDGDVLKVDLSSCSRGTDFKDTLEKIQEMPARKFDWDTKLWEVPAEAGLAERLVKGAGCTAPQEVMDWLMEAGKEAQQELATPLPDDVQGLLIPWAYVRAPWQPEKVNDEVVTGLEPYQRTATAHMVKARRAILGDDMGLGKTLTAISAVEEYRLRNGQMDGPKLVVAPASVKGAWKRELRRWLPPNTEVVVIDGSTPAKRRKQLEQGIELNAWVVVNWEQLRVKKVKKDKTARRADGSVVKRRVTVKEPKEPLLGETEWLAVIADEAHRAKNRKSQQTWGLWLLEGKLMYALTGTAVQNSPDELWPILAWLWPSEYHENGAKHSKGAMAYWSFYSMFVDYYEAYGRKIVTGVKNADALKFRLRDRFIRRTAAILGLQGRKRIYYPVPLHPGQRKLYDEATEQMWFEVRKAADSGDESAKKFIAAASTGGDIYRVPNGAARMVRQMQIIESPELLGGDDDSAVLDDLVDKVMDSRPDQWTVFVQYKQTCDLVKARLEAKGLEVGVYNGDVSAEDRTELEDAFQRGELDVIVGTHAAMREGITLTAGHQQYWVTRPWVPAWADQGESRNDRKGQQNRVNVFIPLAEDTVSDGNIQPTNRRKERIVGRIQPTDVHEEVHQ